MFVAESDDLPTILPPKRRRQQASSRNSTAAAEVAEKAASAAAAAEVKVDLAMQESLVDAHGSERIMREFPRHNWLQHKILQRKVYTPPASTDTPTTSPPPPGGGYSGEVAGGGRGGGLPAGTNRASSVDKQCGGGSGQPEPVQTGHDDSGQVTSSPAPADLVSVPAPPALSSVSSAEPCAFSLTAHDGRAISPAPAPIHPSSAHVEDVFYTASVPTHPSSAHVGGEIYPVPVPSYSSSAHVEGAMAPAPVPSHPSSSYVRGDMYPVPVLSYASSAHVGGALSPAPVPSHPSTVRKMATTTGPGSAKGVTALNRGVLHTTHGTLSSGSDSLDSARRQGLGAGSGHDSAVDGSEAMDLTVRAPQRSRPSSRGNQHGVVVVSSHLDNGGVIARRVVGPLSVIAQGPRASVASPAPPQPPHAPGVLQLPRVPQLLQVPDLPRLVQPPAVSSGQPVGQGLDSASSMPEAAQPPVPSRRSSCSSDDLSPGGLRIDIREASPCRQEDLHPTDTLSSSSFSFSVNERDQGGLGTTFSGVTSADSCQTTDASARSQQEEKEAEVSVVAMEVQGSASSLASTAEREPARCRPDAGGRWATRALPSPMLRSRSSGALPLGSSPQSQAAEEGDGGTRAATATGGGRRQSWEQTRKSGLEDDRDVELTLVKFRSR